MPKRGRPRVHPPKAPPLTPGEQAVLATMSIKYGIGRPSNRTRKLLAVIAYARLRLMQQKESSNGH